MRSFEPPSARGQCHDSFRPVASRLSSSNAGLTGSKAHPNTADVTHSEDGHRSFFTNYRKAAEVTLAGISADSVVQLIELLDTSRRQQRGVFVCGNGGSAAMASHLTGELGKEPVENGNPRFRVFSLVDNTAWITAIANDKNYSSIFVEQLKNLARKQDILIAFSCSGNSQNVVEAVHWAKRHELTTVGITGHPGGQLARLADVVLSVPTSFTPHIQEGHMQIQHLISYYFAETDFHL